MVSFHLKRRRVRRLRLQVSHRNGEVSVVAPLWMPMFMIRHFVQQKQGWIQKQLARQSQCQSLRLPDDGSLLLYLGQKYSIQRQYPETMPVRKQRLVFERGRCLLCLPVSVSHDVIVSTFDNFYRQQLSLIIDKLVQKWQPLLRVEVLEYRIRRMKTRWGSCNIGKKRIWLNLQLAKVEPDLIEYVVVHEMLHLLERYHNAHFYQLMQTHLPRWKQLETRLQQYVL